MVRKSNNQKKTLVPVNNNGRGKDKRKPKESEVFWSHSMNTSKFHS